MIDLDLMNFYNKVIDNTLESKILAMLEEDMEYEKILDLLINESKVNSND